MLKCYVGPYTPESLMEVLGDPYGMLKIKPGLATCKASALCAVLSRPEVISLEHSRALDSYYFGQCWGDTEPTSKAPLVALLQNSMLVWWLRTLILRLKRLGSDLTVPQFPLLSSRDSLVVPNSELLLRFYSLRFSCEKDSSFLQ